MIQNHIREKIFLKAIPLKQLGIRDLAWEKQEAKNLISSLMEDDIGILGGDVYRIDSNQIIPTYENWSCEPNKDETRRNYFQRSKKKAFDYINHYPVDPKEKNLFSLVFTEILD